MLSRLEAVADILAGVRVVCRYYDGGNAMRIHGLPQSLYVFRILHYELTLLLLCKYNDLNLEVVPLLSKVDGFVDIDIDGCKIPFLW